MNSRQICIGRKDNFPDALPMQGPNCPRTIASLIMHGDESAFNQGPQCANARLISAAPELIEALEQCEGYLREALVVEQEQGFDENAAWISIILDNARAAIAKAKGGQL